MQTVLRRLLSGVESVLTKINLACSRFIFLALIPRVVLVLLNLLTPVMILTRCFLRARVGLKVRCRLLLRPVPRWVTWTRTVLTLSSEVPRCSPFPALLKIIGALLGRLRAWVLTLVTVGTFTEWVKTVMREAVFLVMA